MTAPDPPAWLDELDLHVGPPDASMGTRALDLERWFLVDDEWEEQRRLAATLIDERPEEVLVGLDDPAVAGPAAELLDLIRATVPSAGAHDGAGRGPGTSAGAAGLVEARLGVADDLCLLLPGGPGWVLAAGVVCFPSYWRPRDKVGLPLEAVHGPVPGYPGALAGRVDRFLDRLPPGRGVWRRNWLVHDVPDLHLPHHGAPASPASDGRWLRSERQALVRLVDHDAVVFSIRTQQVPLRALAGRPDVAAGLAAAVRGWSPAVRAYKGQAIDDEVLTWLDEAAR